MKAHSPRASALVDAVVAPVPAPEPARICEPEPVPEALREFTIAIDAAQAAVAVIAQPVAEPAPLCACSCEASQVAAYLRELAGKYGPRRAHKLLAMADFVAAAGRA